MLPSSTLPAAGAPRAATAIRTAWHAFAARAHGTLVRWRERRRERDAYRSLCELDERTLHDLGFERCDLWPLVFTDDPARLQHLRAGRDRE